jgi:hypothetical protein
LKALQLTAFADELEIAPKDTTRTVAANVERIRFIFSPLCGSLYFRSARVGISPSTPSRLFVTASTFNKRITTSQNVKFLLP